MTPLRLVVICAAVAVVSTLSARADPVSPAAQSIGGRPANFLTTLFGQARPAAPAPVAMTAPINVLPLAAGTVAGAATAVRSHALAARVPPLPRLRPPQAIAVEAGSKGVPATSVAPVAAGIDQTVTGSIGDPPPGEAPAGKLPTDATASPTPAEAPAAKTEISTIQRSDGMLGDPSDYLVEEPAALAPNAPAPDTVPGPKGEQLPAESKDDTGLAAVPLWGTEPFELVRTLQSLQDRMAQGDVQAIAAQRALMLQADKAFMAADPAVWQDSRNAAAAVTYVLSGGPPDILKKLDTLNPLPAIERRLLEGVLDYASGQADAAAPLLADIDPTRLPASMAGQVAIAQSALAVRTDPVKTMQLLAIARLLAPGTLVEEAAIRRQLLVADRQRDEKEVRSLARQYLDRFRHSVYAGNFRVRFAAALSHMTSLDSEDRFAELDDMLAMVEPESRCDMYLTVALASAMSGRITAAKLAAERASGLALAGSLQEARAKLYHAAALAAMPELTDKAATEITALDRNLLPAPDQAFYDVVKSMLDGVLSGTDLSKIDVATAAPLGDGAKVEEAPIIKQAREALDATAKMIAAAK